MATMTLTNVVLELQKQNQGTNELRADIKKMLKEDVARRKKLDRQQNQIREDKLEQKAQAAKDKAKEKAGGPKGFSSGIRAGMIEASGFGTLRSWAGNIMSGLFGGATAATITGAIGRQVGRGLIFGGAAAIVGAFGEKLFKSMFDDLDDSISLDIPETTKASLAATASKSISNGLIGRIFGRKAGYAAFFGTIIGDGIKSLFSLDPENLQEKVKLFGWDVPWITNDDFISYGSMIAAFFGPSLIGNGIFGAFAGRGGAGATFDPRSNRWRDPNGRYLSAANARAFNRSFVPTGARFGKLIGWAAVIGVVGSMLAGFIGNEFGDDAGKVTQWGVNALMLASLFGPTGLIVAAVAGIGLAGGYALLTWMKGMNERVADGIASRIEEHDKVIDDLLAEGDIDGAANETLRKLQEMRRAQGLGGVGFNPGTFGSIADTAFDAYGLEMQSGNIAPGNVGRGLGLLGQMFNEVLRNRGEKPEDEIAASLRAIIEERQRLTGETDMMRSAMALRGGEIGIISNNYMHQLLRNWEDGYRSDKDPNFFFGGIGPQSNNALTAEDLQRELAMYGGGTTVIDQSTTDNSQVTGASQASYIGNSGMTAVDIRYQRKYAGIRGFAFG
jgi:hypothetical protein